jgi:succinate-semialdehyde dehydrogenase/glutarate-semialdehyde dehydrogenase
VLSEETFGPLLPIVRVKDEDEAIALANDSVFGLSASVWSADTARAVRVAEQLEAGSVAINDAVIVAGMADVPHGGVKQSGIGRTHGRAGLEECVRTKAIVADRFTSWRQAWWFGYSAEHEEGIDAFVRVAHSHSLLERLMALPKLISLVFKSKQ